VERLGSLSHRMGTLKLRYDDVPLSTVICNVIRKMEKTNPKIDFTFESNNDMLLYIDKKQFERVIENILINSIEACSKCENPGIRLLAKEQNSYTVIAVTDNGVGIKREDLDKVFEPFYSTKPTVSNWGVGLSYCQKIIKAFGGIIEADSKLGEGTTINIYIPKAGGRG
jgi:signal transduction histidine kinase